MRFLLVLAMLFVTGCVSPSGSDFPYKGPLRDPVTEHPIDETWFQE